MTTTTTMWTRSSGTPAPVKAMPPRYFVRTVGPRYHVVDTVTGYTVEAHWTMKEAMAAKASRSH